MQHKFHNTTLVLQCKIMQHNNGGEVQYWLYNTKCLSRFFFGEDGSGNPHHSDSKNRSSHPEMFFKKDVLRNFTKFTGKHLYQSLFLRKVAGLSLKIY